MSKQKKIFEECISKIELKEYKNFGTLCNEIGIKKINGNSKIAFMKILKENFIIEKDNYKLIFKEKISHKDKIIKYYIEELTPRQDLIELGIVKHVSDKQHELKKIEKKANIFNMDTKYTVYFSLTEILLKLGMVNKQYYEVKSNDKQFVKQEDKLRNYDEYNYSLAHKDTLHNFFKITHKNYSYAIKTALDSLQKKSILRYRKNTVMSFVKINIPYKEYINKMPKKDLQYILNKKDINPYISKEEAIKLYRNRKKDDDIQYDKHYEYCDSDMVNRILRFKTTAWNKTVDEFKIHHDKYYPEKDFILKKATVTFLVSSYGFMNNTFRINCSIGSGKYNLREIFNYFLAKEFNDYFLKETENDNANVYLYEYDYEAYDILTGGEVDKGAQVLIEDMLKLKKFNKQYLNELTIEKLIENAKKRFTKIEDDKKSKHEMIKFKMYSNDLIELKNNDTEVNIKNDPYYFNYAEGHTLTEEKKEYIYGL